MSNITTLPDSFERQWRVYEGDLRAHFATTGTSPEELAYVLGRLKPLFLQSARTPFDGSGENLVRDLNTWVKSQVGTMMLQVALRDVELFRLRGG